MSQREHEGDRTDAEHAWQSPSSPTSRPPTALRSPSTQPPSRRDGLSSSPTEVFRKNSDTLHSLAATALGALRDGRVGDASELWSKVALRLAAQIDAEERFILPVFRFVDPLCAGRVLVCQRQQRRLADESSRLLHARGSSREQIEAAMRALLHHNAIERAAMLRWADRHLDKATQTLLSKRVADAQ